MQKRSSQDRWARLWLVLALLLVMPTAASPQQMREGTLDGADYLVGVPPQWKGGLVLFAHGYEGEGPGNGNVRTSPMGLLGAMLGPRPATAAKDIGRIGFSRTSWRCGSTLSLCSARRAGP
jgi:hypothetical protein